MIDIAPALARWLDGVYRTGFVILVCLVAGAPAAGADAPLLINIDNPQFRKMVVAVPEFEVDPAIRDDATANAFQTRGAKEMRYLIEFTGLFESQQDAAYKELVGRARRAAGNKVAQLAQQALLAQWRAIGTESLTAGLLVKGTGGINLELRTIDMQRRKVVLGKRYTDIKIDELSAIIKRYANLVMEIYTGRPGIFSSKIAFIGKRHKDDQKQVYVCDFDGSNVTQITASKATKISPHFSPDGRFLTYTSFERRNPDLFMYSFATRRKQVISNYKGINSGAQWAPNGKVLAYSGSKDGDTDIFLLDPFRQVRHKIIRGGGLDVDPTFSPDGKYLAFVSGRFGNPHIFLGTLAWQGESSVKIVSDQRLTYAGWYNSTPAWSPDSSKIVFAGYDKDIDRYDVFMMNPDGKQLERLTLKTGDNESPSFSPNGLMIAFQSNRIGTSNAKGRPQLWIMNRDGSSQRRLETGLYEAQTPSWSAASYHSR